jgi:hypothetical protein
VDERVQFPSIVLFLLELEELRRLFRCRREKYYQSISHTHRAPWPACLTPPPAAFGDETSFVGYPSACAVIHPFGCHIVCQMRFTLSTPFLALLISIHNVKAFNESLLMCVSPSHLNYLEVLAYGVNESETLPTSFPRSGAFLSRNRATCVHLI